MITEGGGGLEEHELKVPNWQVVRQEQELQIVQERGSASVVNSPITVQKGRVKKVLFPRFQEQKMRPTKNTPSN